jgi:hypothetical protein
MTIKRLLRRLRRSRAVESLVSVFIFVRHHMNLYHDQMDYIAIEHKFVLSQPIDKHEWHTYSNKD